MLKDSHLVVIKLNEKKNMTIRTVPKSNRKIVKTEKIDTPTYILTWHGTGTSIKSVS